MEKEAEKKEKSKTSLNLTKKDFNRIYKLYKEMKSKDFAYSICISNYEVSIYRTIKNENEVAKEQEFNATNDRELEDILIENEV